MSDETTLLPCPFCGGEAEMLHAVGEWWAICKFCKATTEAHTDKGFAIAAWNARADYHGFEQAAIEAWESVKSWNTRAELGSGTLTAEQVCEAIYAHSIHADCADADWQAIADELNARAERTCQFTIKDNMNESEGMGDVWIECSACHCVFDFYADEWLMKMSYCPNCGARVIGTEAGE